MPYVQRDEFGNITGLFANQQGWTNEFLPDDEASVAAFLAPGAPGLQLSSDISVSGVERVEAPTASDRLDALETRVAALESKAG